MDQLPDVVAGAHRAAYCFRGRKARRAKQTLALSGQASAMVLTKLGEHDLAWIASERGLNAAQDADDPALIGSLNRSMVHTLQSHGRTDASTRLAERTADDLRPNLDAGSARETSVYGTLLLAASMTAARAGDRSTVDELLDEADHYAAKLGHDANHLWTAFGPTNVAVHRVATAVAQDDITDAERHTRQVDPSTLPTERRIRYLFDVAMVAVEARPHRRSDRHHARGRAAGPRAGPQPRHGPTDRRPSPKLEVRPPRPPTGPTRPPHPQDPGRCLTAADAGRRGRVQTVSTDDPTLNFITPRVAAGVLFTDDEDRVLMVVPSYKDYLDIPGGYVENGETPYQAARREVFEELGIKPSIGRLLVADWWEQSPEEAGGPKLLLVFDADRLTDDQIRRMSVDGVEILDFEFKAVDEISGFTIPRLANRISLAMDARATEHTVYLENGLPATGAD